jgi:AraC-like DNA-binding protein
MKLSLFDLLVIVGISQGIFVGSLLLFSKRNQQSRRFLGLILFTFILLSTKILLHTLGLWNTHPFRYFPLAIDLAIQPLLYLFIRATVNPLGRFRKRDLFHFIPAVVFFAHASIVYINVLTTNVVGEKEIIANMFYYNQVKQWEDYLSIISAWIYCCWAYIELKQYRLWLQNNVGDLTYPNYTWLRNILMIFVVLIFNLTLNIAADALGFGRDHFYHWQFFYIIMAGCIYYMGIEGYRSPALPNSFSKKKVDGEVKPLLAKENLSRVKEKILAALVIEKVYTDPEISLVRLSEKLEVTPGLVSYTINTSFKRNFRNLINEYRLEEVKKRLIDPRTNHLSILGIALECGFNSEASFYRIFKKSTGKSPKEFMETHTF